VSARRALAVLARTPLLHQTKTRLVPALGATGALRAHIEMVEDTLARLQGLSTVSASLWVTEVDATTRGWASEFNIPLHVQPDGDLGERMHGVLQMLLADSDQACLIGTDCPDIDMSYIERAFAALAGSDVVIGPAEDGGYGLVGLSEACAQLFEGIDWGTENVMQQTLERAATAGLNTLMLQTIWDVDTPDDWERYRLRDPG